MIWHTPWPRAEEYRFLRAMDAAIALADRDTLGDDAGYLTVLRLLTVMLSACPFSSSDPAGMLSAAASGLDTVLTRLVRGQGETAVREAFRGALSLAIEMDFGTPDEADNDHPLWSMFSLDPFARRLRILARNQGKTMVSLARAVGEPAHQVRHWAAGNSKPKAPQRIRLAAAFGVNEIWFCEQRDHGLDTPLYRHRECQCATGAGLHPAPLDDVTEFEGSGYGLWCAGCGQPYLASPSGWLYPVPVDRSGWQPEFTAAVRDDFEFGGELGRPWPHALWVASPDPHRESGYRTPPLYSRRAVWI